MGNLHTMFAGSIIPQDKGEALCLMPL